MRAVDCVRLELADRLGELSGASASMGTLLPRFPEDIFRTGVARTHVSPAVHCSTAASIAVVVSYLIATSGTIQRSCEMEGVEGDVHLVLSNILGVTLGGFAAVLWRRRQAKRPSQLQRAIKQFRKRLLSRVSRHCPMPVERGPYRAVSISSLMEFHHAFSDFIQAESAYYVSSNICQPVTRPEQLSVAELLGARKTTFFVSYFWGQPFEQLVRALGLHATTYDSEDAPKSEFGYWVDCLSNNQWRVEEELGDGLTCASFYLALRSPSCQGFCLVLDEQATPLMRGWALLEVAQSFQRQEDSGTFQISLCSHQGVVGEGGCSGVLLGQWLSC